MHGLTLTDEEIVSIRSLLEEVTSQYKSSEDLQFLDDSAVIAHDLPKRVRKFLRDFKLREPAPGICMISGFPINQEKAGRTPDHWKNRPQVSPTLMEELLILLFGAILGEALGWATQQDGHIVHDVIPIRGHENEQLGSGSEQLLWWHNEDAFHPYRGDYVGLMCIRNPYSAATTFASIEMVSLPEKYVETLFQELYFIRPDESHLPKNKGAGIRDGGEVDHLLESSYQHIQKMNTKPSKLAVLYGDPKCPYVRIDPYFMDPIEEDPTARQALEALIRAIDGALSDLVLQPGDCCFIDNFRTVHGRKPFKATFDGYDRWLKRIIVAGDLRKSRSARVSPAARVLF